jgi:D-sedoheptulose 7-phosphate isomerase
MTIQGGDMTDDQKQKHIIPYNTIDRIYADNPTPDGFGVGYLEYLTNVIGSIEIDDLSEFIRVLQTAYRDDKQVFFMGNGGSAATANHFAVDLGKGTRVPGARGFRAMSLASNIAYITAQANDEGYESVFTGQLESLLNPGDVVVGITASGNSPNLVDAFTYALDHDAITVGILGFDGGKLKGLSDHIVLVPTPKGEYGPVEDIHMVVDHLVTNYLHRWMRDVVAQNGDAGSDGRSR